MIDVKLKLTIDEEHEEYFEKIMKIITLIPGVEKAESFDYIEYNNEEPCWAEEHSPEIQEKLEELKNMKKLIFEYDSDSNIRHYVNLLSMPFYYNNILDATRARIKILEEELKDYET